MLIEAESKCVGGFVSVRHFTLDNEAFEDILLKLTYFIGKKSVASSIGQPIRVLLLVRLLSNANAKSELQFGTAILAQMIKFIYMRHKAQATSHSFALGLNCLGFSTQHQSPDKAIVLRLVLFCYWKTLKLRAAKEAWWKHWAVVD